MRVPAYARDEDGVKARGHADGPLQTGFEVIAGGVRMHARTAVPAPRGGPVVILVHGMIISSSYMVPTLLRLAPYCRVYAPDLPGYGKSQKLSHALSLPELADSLAVWMDAAGIPSAIMVGNSYGCSIITEFALRYPHKLKKAVLQGPTTDAGARSFLHQTCRFLRDARYEPLSIALLMIRDYAAAGPRVVVETVRYALHDRIEEKLPFLRVPVLVVCGSKDPLVPLRWAKHVVSLLPEGSLKVIPGKGHALVYSAPDELVKALCPFLYIQ